MRPQEELPVRGTIGVMAGETEGLYELEVHVCVSKGKTLGWGDSKLPEGWE